MMARMKLQLMALNMLLLAAVGLSADPEFSLPNNDQKGQGLKTVAIKGIAKFKPGGSAMILSLLVQGSPGLMPGGSAPGSKPTPPSQGTPSGTPMPPSPPGPSPSPSPGAPSPSPGASTPAASTGAPTPSPSPGAGSGVSTPSSSGGGSGGFSAQEQEGLAEHNKFRVVHGSQPMKLNRKMCDEAAAYAKKIANTGSMKHSSKEERNGQGENLAMGCSSNKAQTVKEAVTNWYDEVCDPGYKFDHGRGQSGTGHFTQVVWNDSVELGIGIAEVTKRGMKCAYIVGRYEPLGNFYTGNEDYKKNVKKGKFDRQAYCSKQKNQKSSKKSSTNLLSKILK